MEKFLQIVEPTTQPDELKMDPEKSNFFDSKLKVRDFAKISSSEFQNLSFDDKSSLFKKYYAEMLANIQRVKVNYFFAFVWLFFVCILTEFGLALIKILKLSFFVCR